MGVILSTLSQSVSIFVFFAFNNFSLTPWTQKSKTIFYWNIKKKKKIEFQYIILLMQLLHLSITTLLDLNKTVNDSSHFGTIEGKYVALVYAGFSIIFFVSCFLWLSSLQTNLLFPQWQRSFEWQEWWSH